jgi:hypothetical protein
VTDSITDPCRCLEAQMWRFATHPDTRAAYEVEVAIRLKQAATAISQGMPPAGDSYDELQRLRSIPVTPLRCGQHGCRQVISVVHPLPDPLVAYCSAHQPEHP